MNWATIGVITGICVPIMTLIAILLKMWVKVSKDTVMSKLRDVGESIGVLTTKIDNIQKEVTDLKLHLATEYISVTNFDKWSDKNSNEHSEFYNRLEDLRVEVEKLKKNGKKTNDTRS